MEQVCFMVKMLLSPMNHAKNETTWPNDVRLHREGYEAAFASAFSFIRRRTQVDHTTPSALARETGAPHNFYPG